MDKTLDLDEAIARLIDPSSWRVFDSELERVKRHHPNGGYDPDNFKDRASLALASRILTLIAAARPAVVSDEVVPAVFDEFNRQFMNHVEAMRAALALLPGGVPDGYMLVPREPTEAMIRSGQGAADDKYWLWRGLGERPVGSGLDGMALYVDAAYRAMLSASPKEVSQ